MSFSTESPRESRPYFVMVHFFLILKACNAQLFFPRALKRGEKVLCNPHSHGCRNVIQRLKKTMRLSNLPLRPFTFRGKISSEVRKFGYRRTSHKIRRQKNANALIWLSAQKFIKTTKTPVPIQDSVSSFLVRGIFCIWFVCKFFPPYFLNF